MQYCLVYYTTKFLTISLTSLKLTEFLIVFALFDTPNRTSIQHTPVWYLVLPMSISEDSLETRCHCKIKQIYSHSFIYTSD